MISANETNMSGFLKSSLHAGRKGRLQQANTGSVHKVRRIPPPDPGAGYTSAATVAVLPEAEVDIEINPNDIRIDAVPVVGPRQAGVSTRFRHG